MSLRAENVSAFVLAGGASIRMGTDKALIEIDGVPLIQRAVQLLERCGLEPRIVAARPDLARFAPVIEDRQSGCGPLSGIEAGLLASNAERLIFIPVDMPFLPASLIDLLLARARKTEALVTIPRAQGIAQPLCAVYHRTLLPMVSLALAAGDRKVMRVMQQAAGKLNGSIDIFDLETVLAASGELCDWPQISANALANCNTPEEFERIYSHCSSDRIQ